MIVAGFNIVINHIFKRLFIKTYSPKVVTRKGLKCKGLFLHWLHSIDIVWHLRSDLIASYRCGMYSVAQTRCQYKFLG